VRRVACLSIAAIASPVGGERRRVSIAAELVVRPAVFLLDEPLSGLDSYTAQRILAVLHQYAHGDNSGQPPRVVAMSIHQPSHTTFLKFDKVRICAGGWGRARYCQSSYHLSLWSGSSSHPLALGFGKPAS
jgi:ABC-type multidrug transport system ATPase subunit